jgi:excinuclease UvrABC nuclease subunit
MLPITNLEALPRDSGIYKILNYEGTIIYVGQSKNIYTRWKNGHHKLGVILAECGTNASIHWVLLPEWLLNRAESAAIQFYKPKLNQKQPPIV